MSTTIASRHRSAIRVQWPSLIDYGNKGLGLKSEERRLKLSRAREARLRPRMSRAGSLTGNTQIFLILLGNPVDECIRKCGGRSCTAGDASVKRLYNSLFDNRTSSSCHRCTLTSLVRTATTRARSITDCYFVIMKNVRPLLRKRLQCKDVFTTRKVFFTFSAT